jgi:hypothetical protein
MYYVGPELPGISEAIMMIVQTLVELYAQRRRYRIYTFLRDSSSPLARLTLPKRARESIVDQAVAIYALAYDSREHPGIHRYNSDPPDRLRTYLRLAAGLDDPETREVGKGRGLLSVLTTTPGGHPKIAMMLYATVNSDPKFVSINTDDPAPRICQIWYLVSKHPRMYPLEKLAEWYMEDEDAEFVFNEHFVILLNEVATIVQKEECDFITFEITADENGCPQEDSIKLMMIYQMYFRQMLASWTATRKGRWPPAYRTPYVINYAYKSPKFDGVPPANLLLCAVPISPAACSKFACGKIKSELARNIVRKVLEQYYEPYHDPEEMKEGIKYTNEVLGPSDSWPPEVAVIPFDAYISEHLPKYLKKNKHGENRG